VPFEAVNGFFDPSVQFGLQFEEVTEGEERPAPANMQEQPATKRKRSPASAPMAVPAPAPAAKPPAATASSKREKPEKAEKPDKPDKPDKPVGGGEVVRLDRFRKK
jgi:hypothetical protein